MEKSNKKYIDKSALAAEIEHHLQFIPEQTNAFIEGEEHAYRTILSFLDTIEVKEIEEMYERPTIKIEDDVSVISRLQYIDDDLKQIADFILEYASWNLHKDEWNHPVLEVPLFRVLDALVQRGKPYCEC